ncbi:NAD(P)-binding domain-containing protein [Streptacidiphilus rugosus]|uniref:NAD(P)-binding domain-containing protein n=1 Tax=Streptacidiphilus rugosus TaxID=405783 RepID=UPI00056A4511|nr:NAD(P)-binding domain-containing protein [Streptacidiphilus rugosus]
MSQDTTSSQPVLVLDHAATAAALAAASAALTDALGRALTAIARGEASSPPRIAARAPHGLLGAMPGYVPGLGLAAKLITVFGDPDRPGRSTHRGLVAHFDEHDGRLLALLDAEPLTAARTAATATLAFHTIARSDAARIAVIGTGTQAAAQLALLTPEETASATVAGRDPVRVRALAERFGATPAASIEAAVRAADVVLCCTGAREPVVRRAWLAPGTHVGSVGGSDGPELDAETIRDAALFAEWPGAAGSPPPAGAHELQSVPADRVTLLGAVLDGTVPGRAVPDGTELTVFKSTGHAALDVAAASVAHATARDLGLGITLEL